MAATVAFDVTPLRGARTGIGQFVACARPAIEALPGGPGLVPYVLSLRARTLDPGTRRLPYPATAAVHLWRWMPVPRGRRTLQDASVVHATNFVAPPTGLPTVITVHDCSFVTRSHHARPLVRAFGDVVRRSIDRGAWVHTPSEHVADEVRTLFGTERVRALHHGPPPMPRLPHGEVPLPGLEGRPYIIAVGTREPRKNLARLVLAFGAVHARHPDLALVLIGKPSDDQPAIDAAIDALPRRTAEAVLLTDWVPGPHRSHAVHRARVLAYPSLDEGFGFPMLEAMQHGVPVVASNAGAIPEIARDAAALVDPTDIEALAEALSDVVSDEPWRAGLIASGRRRVRDFDWRRQAEGLATLYGDAEAADASKRRRRHRR